MNKVKENQSKLDLNKLSKNQCTFKILNLSKMLKKNYNFTTDF